jgi:predicted GNAT family N-acyltransferase
MEIRIEKYQKGQEAEIHRLIKRVYDEYVSCDYSDDGNEFFYNWIAPEKIAERQTERVNIFTAMADTELAGMIEIRENKYVSLLFVDKQYQGKGIARQLFEKAVENCIQYNPGLDKFYVHASPYSIPIYKSMGFKENGTMQEENGIKYLPMEIDI